MKEVMKQSQHGSLKPFWNYTGKYLKQRKEKHSISFFILPNPQLDAAVQLTILVIVHFCIWAEKSFKRE